MSTTRTASSRGRGGSMPNRRGGSPVCDAAPELLLGREKKVLVERVGINLDLDPFAATGNYRKHRGARGDHPHVVLELRHVLLGRRLFREGPRQHELGLEHRACRLNHPVERCRHPFWMGCRTRF